MAPSSASVAGSFSGSSSEICAPFPPRRCGHVETYPSFLGIAGPKVVFIGPFVHRAVPEFQLPLTSTDRDAIFRIIDDRERDIGDGRF